MALPTSLLAALRPLPAMPIQAAGPSALPLSHAAPQLPQSQQDALDSVFAFHGAAEFTPTSLPEQVPALAVTSKPLTPMSTGEVTARVNALPPSQVSDDPLRFSNLVAQLALPDPVALALAPRDPSPAGSAHSFAFSASSPKIDLSDKNWHCRPDTPYTATDYSLAISAIQSGSALTMADFLAAPGPPAIHAPGNPAVLSPAIPAHDGPTTPSIWEASPRPTSYLQKVDALAASFPRIQEDLLLVALSLNGENLTQASDGWTRSPPARLTLWP